MKINLIVLFLMLFYTNSYSQNGSWNGNIPISFSAMNGLVISRVSGDLDFGEVLSTTSIQMLSESPDNGVLFEVNGIPRERIAVNYSSSVVLDNSSWVSTNGGQLDDLIFTPIVEHTRRNPTYTNPRSLRNGRRIRLRNDSGIGKLFIWVGGDLEISANQEIGEYLGTFNITVAY